MQSNPKVGVISGPALLRERRQAPQKWRPFTVRSPRPIAPMICLQVVTLVTVLWGRKSGLIGTILANLIFAFFLFPPRGSIVIHDSTERLMLLAFDGCAFCIFWLASQKSRGEFLTVSTHRWGGG